MAFDVLYNFISPVTGRILSTRDYVLVGDRQGIATPSPALIDLRLDFIDLARNYDIARSATFVIGSPNPQLTNAQVLDSMPNGYVYSTEGTVDTIAIIPLSDLPDLTHGKVWIGDGDDRPVEGDPPPGPRGPRGKTGKKGAKGEKGKDGSDGTDGSNGRVGFSVTLDGIDGLSGLGGLAGLAGLGGLAGSAGGQGAKGAAGAEGETTVIVTTNLDLNGNRVANIAQSPEGDLDAVSTRFLWDILHDRVIIKWEE